VRESEKAEKERDHETELFEGKGSRLCFRLSQPRFRVEGLALKVR
jgi:hypothetical protein